MASASPGYGSLRSVTWGMGISMQMGLGPKALRKLQSCLVAAEAACSSGDLPVVAVESRLAAVVGLAIAIEVAAVPAELAAAVVELLKASRGAAQPVVKHPRMRAQRVRRVPIKKADQTERFDLPCGAAKRICLFAFADNVKYSSSPRFAHDRLEFTIRGLVI